MYLQLYLHTPYARVQSTKGIRVQLVVAAASSRCHCTPENKYGTTVLDECNKGQYTLDCQKGIGDEDDK